MKAKGKGEKIIVTNKITKSANVFLNFRFLLFSFLCMCLGVSAVIFLSTGKARAQTGGVFDLSHNVIAGGGSNSSGGPFRLDGTAGQNLAGSISSGSGFLLRGGFWAFEPFSPTSAAVSISGRVLTLHGSGIGNARLVLTDASGTVRPAISNSFGYYRFDGVPAGDTYFLSATSKGIIFTDPIIAITPMEDIVGVNFQGMPQ